MSTTRQEQAMLYAAGIVVTGFLFALTVLLASAQSARIASDARVREIDRRQRAVAERADSVVDFIETLIKRGDAARITNIISRGDLIGNRDTTLAIAGAPTDSVTRLTGVIQIWLTDRRPSWYDSTMGDYLILFSDELKPIFISANMRELWDPSDEQLSVTQDQVLAILDSLSRISPEAGHIHQRVFGRDLISIVQRKSLPGSSFSHVFAATNMPPATTGFDRVAAALAIVSPLVLLGSVLFAWRIAGRPMVPVERMINEVQAISDGRSLHRRLAIDHSSSEMSRLAVTLNEMMQRLETSFTALRTFTADASHELNTPLAVLRADVERALSTEGGSTDQLVALEEALQEITRMSGLVESLLTLARADEGRFDLHLEPVDLAALTRDVYETAVLLGEDAGVTVKLTTLEQATVQGDHGRLRQLFLNLVTNAIKYTPRGGRVDLSLTRRLDGIAFAVRDTGIGISANDLPHVFERFWRADHSRSRGAKVGFGLGLPIGNWIAQAHRGSLTATSKLGKGSTFTVTLPFDENDPGHTSGRPISAEVGAEESDSE